jgi:hypothetical protein
VVLPTGEVLTVNDADEVVGPGSGKPVPQAELFDPVSKTWTPMASDRRHRSYHSSAVLLPDGRVLVGGHGPINTLYGPASASRQKNLGWTPPVTDPTLSIYSPPYLLRGDRPVIKAVNPSIAYNQALTIHTTDAKDITTVVLILNQSATHLVDGDQRSLVLRIVSRTGDSVTVSVPGNTVLPPAPTCCSSTRARRRARSRRSPAWCTSAARSHRRWPPGRTTAQQVAAEQR